MVNRDREITDRIVEIGFIILIIGIIILKLLGIIQLSWLWLLSPFWILFSLGIILACVVLIHFLINEIIEKRKRSN